MSETAGPSLPAWLGRLALRPGEALERVRDGWAPAGLAGGLWLAAFLAGAGGAGARVWNRPLLPVGSLSLADLDPKLLGGQAAILAAALLAAPLAFHAAGRLLGGRATLRQGATAYFFAAFCAALLHGAAALAFGGRPLLFLASSVATFAVLFRLLAAGYRTVYGLSALSPFAAPFVFLALAGVPAGLSQGLWLKRYSKALAVPYAQRLKDVSLPLAPVRAGAPNAAEAYAPVLTNAYLSKGDRKAANEALLSGVAAPALSSLVDAHRAELEAFRRGAAIEYCDVSAGRMTRRSPTEALPVFGGWLDTARLLLLEAVLADAGGRPADAAAGYAVVLAGVLQMTRQPNVGLLAGLVARTMVDTAYPGVASLLSSGRAGAREAAALRRALAPLRGAVAAAVEEGVAGEMELFGLARGIIAEGFAVSYSARTREAALAGSRAVEERLLRDTRAAIRENRPELIRSLMAELERQAASTSRFAALKAARCSLDPPNLGACVVFASGTMPRFDRLVGGVHVSQARLAVLEAAASVRAWEAARGAPPARLEDIGSPPPDPFAGFAPLRYTVEGRRWRVYSIGPDRRDDGGLRVFIEPEGAEPDAPPAPGDIVIAGEAPGKPAAPRRRSRR